MAKIVTIECDAPGCRAFERPEDQAELPYGWLRVTVFREGSGSEKGQFCSTEHVVSWLERDGGI